MAKLATITYIIEKRKINDIVSVYGAIVKIGKKSYAISFESSRYYNGDLVSFSPERVRFLEANVKPSANMMYKTKLAIIDFKVDYRSL